MNLIVSVPEFTYLLMFYGQGWTQRGFGIGGDGGVGGRGSRGPPVFDKFRTLFFILFFNKSILLPVTVHKIAE